MKQILVMMAAVVLVGCGKKDLPETQAKKPQAPKATPEKLIADPIVEKAVREELEKPEGKLTEADLEKVTELTLANTKITDAGLKEVAKLQNLADLFLYHTKITDAGLKEVAKLQKLTRLILYHTRITDAGLKEVAKLQKLTTLSLAYTQITKAGVAELKKALPNCKIQGP